MTGRIDELQRDRGTGHIVGDDGKTYRFHRGALQDGWFHDLRTGDVVTFEPEHALRANLFRIVRRSSD